MTATSPAPGLSRGWAGPSSVRNRARPARPAAGLRAGLTRLLLRTGARLALVQSLVVVLAFVLAGYFSHLAIDAISREQMRKVVMGETVSLEAEFRAKGGARLPHTVTKRTQLWRGFSYRLTGAGGTTVAGDLPGRAFVPGWSTPCGQADGRRVCFLAYTERMADGAVLSVGQDMSAADSQADAVDRVLFVSGLIGVGFCLAASYLFSRGVWRRVESLVASAKAVAGGRLDVRVRAGGEAVRDDIDELGAAFDAMLDRLETLVAQVRQVSTDIAHDLRTPLTRVRQTLEGLRGDLQGGAAAPPKAVDQIERDLDEVLRIFAALLRLAEIEGEDYAVCEGPIDLAQLVGRMAETYRPDIESSGRTLAVDAQPAVVRGDAQLIAQAVANLLDNALRHPPPGTPIAMSVRSAGRSVELAVVDRGAGVPAECREMVLRRFKRLEASRSSAGSGLGLAIVAAIARRHGAQLILGDAHPGLSVVLAFPGRSLA